MNKAISTIPYRYMRYPTVGDWAGNQITVAEMGNEDFHFLIALHELIEQHLCNKRGISDASVTAFDKQFKGDEPGADPAAPYYREHLFASKIEKEVADELGVDWKLYGDTVLKVGNENENQMDEEVKAEQSVVSDGAETSPAQDEGQPQHEEGGAADGVGEGTQQDAVQE